MQFENLDCLMFQKIHVNSSQLFKDLSKLKNLKSIYFFENASFNIIPEEIIGLKNIEVLNNILILKFLIKYCKVLIR